MACEFATRINVISKLVRILAITLIGTVLGASSSFAQYNSGDSGSGSSVFDNSSNSNSSNSNSSGFGTGRFGNKNNGSSSSNSGFSNGSGNKSSTQQTDVTQNKNLKNRDQKRNTNSNTPGTATQKTPNQQMVTQKGKPKQSTGSRGSGGAKGSSSNIEFKMKPDSSSNVLYIESADMVPTMDIPATEGQKFATRVVLQNGHHAPYQNIEISLKYDPNTMVPVGIDDSPIENLLTGDSVTQFNARKGMITFKAKLAEPHKDEYRVLFKIEWKALALATHANLQFVNTPKNKTRIYAGSDQSILMLRGDDEQVEVSERTGLVDASVTIAPSEATADELKDDGRGLTVIQLANSISQGTAEGGIRLVLKSAKSSVNVGDEFLVDIDYDNPKRAELDTVKLKLKFDPKVLQVVDYDEDNWITQGTNIHDGDVREELPFDYHIRNTAYNSSGEIYYEMGFSNRVEIPSRGRIATIRFKAIAQEPSTEISFDLNEDDRDQKTSVTFLGFNLIGTPGGRSNALSSAVIRVN